MKSASLHQTTMLTGVETRTMQILEVVMCSGTIYFTLNVNFTKIKKGTFDLRQPKVFRSLKQSPSPERRYNGR